MLASAKQIGTADELTSFAYRIGEAFGVRWLVDHADAEHFLDVVMAGLTCELLTAPDGSDA